MKKDEILFKVPRKIRRANGSNTIALPPEVVKILKIEESEETNIIVYKSGKVEIQKGDK